MATIRATTIASAVLLALQAAMPAHAQSGQTGAPLQLVPGADQATRAKTAATRKAIDRPAYRKAAKDSGFASNKDGASKTGPKDATGNTRTARRSAQNRVAQPAPKSFSKTVVAGQPQNRTRTRAAQRAAAQQAIAAAMPETRDEDSPAMSFVPMPSQQVARVQASSKRADNQSARDDRGSRESAAENTAENNVMRDGDTVSLIARLPWWRNERLQPIRYGSEEAESQVMAVADAWLLANAPGTPESNAPEENGAQNHDTHVVLADAVEVNAIDRSFASIPAPAVPTFWHSLVAILGGALAAAAVAAASARFLFARRALG